MCGIGIREWLNCNRPNGKRPVRMDKNSATTSQSPPTQPSAANRVGFAAAVSIGIGGMVGAGIFSILGVVAQVAGNAMWLSFAIGGVVALLSTY